MNINDILAKNPNDWDDEELLFAGSCYLRGDGVPVDEKKCFEYVKRSAELNNKTAKAFLGELYLRGCGCAPDYKMASQLCLETARIGNANSMLNMGYMYMTGTGVSRDYEKAKLWLSRSIARSESCKEAGQPLLDKISAIQANERKNSFFGARAPSAYEIARQQRERIASALLELVKDDYFVEGERGDYLGNTPKDQYCLSVILRREDFAGNLKEAYELLVKSAKGGYADAYMALAGIVYHYKGTYVEYDKENYMKTVAEYVQKAEELGSPRGTYIYWQMLYMGYYSDEDKEQSLYYLYLSYLRNDIDGVTTWYYTSEQDKKTALEINRQKEKERAFREYTAEQIYQLADKYITDEHDYAMAKEYFLESYRRGYMPALYKLRLCCCATNDYEGAKKYQILCAKDGEAVAQYELGYFLRNKTSPPSALIRFSIGDYVEGTWEEWLSKACAQNYKEAIMECASAYEYTDRKKAIEYLEKAYSLGVTEAARRAGMIYYGVADYVNATQWFKKAMEKDIQCVYYLGCICETQRNYKMAIVYYEKVRDAADGSLRDTVLQKLNTLYENKCMHCGAYFSKQEKKGFFGTKTYCSNCGNRIK